MKNILQHVPITTQRLQLESLSMKYIQEIYKEFTDEVTKRLRASTPKNIEEEEARIITTDKKHKQWTDLRLVVTGAEGEFIWCCGIMDLDTHVPELWLWLKQSARGKGYGKEVVGALINRLENHKKFEYIIYRACIENIGSQKIAESFGWELQCDESGNAKIFTEWKFDKSSSFPAVEYKIYKK